MKRLVGDSGIPDRPVADPSILKVAETYTNALSTISPKKATANFHRLFINFAKFYEEGGTTGEAEKDLDSARKILEKATKVNFRTVEELAEIWCEWAEMELRHDNYDEAIRVMQRAAVIPKNPRINYHEHVRFYSRSTAIWFANFVDVSPCPCRLVYLSL